MIPETRFARAGDLHIAYQAIGQGPPDLVLADQWFSHVEALWDLRPLAEFRRRLASFSRLILFDKRGVGMSDPVPLNQLPTFEEWVDDLRAVLDAVGSERAALVTNIGGTFMAVVCAATFPDRVSSLVIVDGCARFLSAPDYPMGVPPEEIERRLEDVETEFGRGIMLDYFAPSLRQDQAFRAAWARYERQAVSPGSAMAMLRLLYSSDVRHVLPSIQIPTLVIHHKDARQFPISQGRYLADRIPGAKFVELRGEDSLIWAGDQDAMVAEIQEFITGIRPMPEPDRVLATILITDIVDSTARAAELGDHRWRGLLADHDRLVRAELARGGGREIKTTGDGFLATFDGPARAVRTASAIRESVRSLGLEVRAGLHTGEMELTAGDIAGVAVHIASRVATLAGANEILASSTVKDLVAGSGISFVDRGIHTLRGIPGEWHVYAAEEVAGL